MTTPAGMATPVVPGTRSSLQISVRRLSADGTRYVEIGDGTGAINATLTIEANNFGTWQAAWPLDCEAARIFEDALASTEDKDQWGLVFRHPDTQEIIASGPSTTIICAEGRPEGITPDAVSVWGVTDEEILRNRIMFADPAEDVSTTAITQFAVADDVRTGPAEDIFLGFVADNLGPDALITRRRNNTLVVPESQGRGLVTTYTSQSNTLLSMGREVFARAGLAFQIVQDATTGKLVLEVREPTARTGVIWSVQAGTATALALKSQRRPKTSVIVSGSGEDPTTPYVRADAAAPSGGFTGPREEYIKITADDTEFAEMRDAGRSELEEDAGEIGVKIVPTLGTPWVLGRDFKINDMVIVSRRSADVQVPVTSVVYSHPTGGVVVEEPRGGGWEDASTEPILRKLLNTLRRYERRRP